MAEIRPLRAWRYSEDMASEIENLTAPLFDVVSENQREKLFQHPHNSIHLSLPRGSSPENTIRETVARWKADGIIRQDSIPGIYVYYQYFTLPGSGKELCRKGFVANFRITDWDEKVLLRHENTIPHSVDERIKVLDASQINVSPTHGLYTDPTHQIEKYLDAAIAAPIYEVEDYQGVRDVLSVIHDARIIQEIIDLLRDKQIILADGHHRYESSLLYQKQKQSENPDHTGNEGYNFHLMYFTNTESDDLRILPTHRLISDLPDFDESTLIEKLEPYFHTKVVDNVYDIGDVILGKKYAFGLITKGGCIKIRLKEDMEKEISWNFPDPIKKLALTVLHYFVIEKILGIKGKDQRSSRSLSFERNLPECIERVRLGHAQIALINQDISIDIVKEVCASGYTLPQKSTYFFPKVICGFMFGSIHPDEFHSNFDGAFR